MTDEARRNGEAPALQDVVVHRRIQAQPLPDPPPQLLEDGLALIRVALSEARTRRPRLPARLAAAAASGDGADLVELFEPERGLSTRWERSAEGSLSVTVTATDPGEEALVALSWHARSGGALTLVTPLAPAPGGAFVRYEVEDVDRQRRAVDIDVTAARAVPAAEVDLEAVKRAFSRRPRGVVIRAWRTFLERSESPGPLDTVVRNCLRNFEE